MQIGEKITRLRKMSGYTQEQLAEKLSISRQTLSKWENGTSVPDWESVQKISSLFLISLDELADKQITSSESKENIGITLQDLIKINASNRRITILWMISLELIVICILTIIVISIINDATKTIQYMLYRYIVVTDYSNILFADYHHAFVFAGIAGVIGIVMSIFCLIISKIRG